MYMAASIARASAGPVVPGDQLRVEVNVITFRGPFCKVQGHARVNGELAAEATMMCAMVDVRPDGTPVVPRTRPRLTRYPVNQSDHERN